MYAHNPSAGKRLCWLVRALATLLAVCSVRKVRMDTTLLFLGSGILAAARRAAWLGYTAPCSLGATRSAKLKSNFAFWICPRSFAICGVSAPGSTDECSNGTPCTTPLIRNFGAEEGCFVFESRRRRLRGRFREAVGVQCSRRRFPLSRLGVRDINRTLSGRPRCHPRQVGPGSFGL